MANKARKNNKSLWEKSMKLAVNITKVSVLSLAEKSLGVKPGPVLPPPPAAAAAAAAATTPFKVMDATSITILPYNFPESRRSQEPEKSASKPSSYVMELPVEEIYVIREEGTTNVDGRASDYIRWFHERIRNDSIDAANKVSPIILPPPPRRVK